jgi:hypothetical protein
MERLRLISPGSIVAAQNVAQVFYGLFAQVALNEMLSPDELLEPSPCHKVVVIKLYQVQTVRGVVRVPKRRRVEDRRGERKC